MLLLNLLGLPLHCGVMPADTMPPSLPVLEWRGAHGPHNGDGHRDPTTSPDHSTPHRVPACDNVALEDSVQPSPVFRCPKGGADHTLVPVDATHLSTGYCRSCFFSCAHPSMRFHYCAACGGGYCAGCLLDHLMADEGHVSQQQTSVATQPPTTLREEDGLRAGLFGCCDEPQRIADVTICCSCFLSHAAHFRGFDPTGGDDTTQTASPPGARWSDYAYGTFTMIMEGLGTFGALHWSENYHFRKKVFQLYGIQPQEDRCVTGLKSCLCCLSANQMYREMKLRGHDIGGTCLAPVAAVPKRASSISADSTSSTIHTTMPS